MEYVESGPLRIEITAQGQPVTNDERFDTFPAWARDVSHVEKLVARFSVTTTSGEMLLSNAPFFYGSTQDPAQLADAREVWESMREDLRSVAEYNGSFEESWPEWADDLGDFSDASPESIRASIATFRELRARVEVIREAIGGDRYALLMADPDDPFFNQD